MIKTQYSCYILIEQFSVGKFGRMLQSDENRFLSLLQGSFLKEEPSLRFGFTFLRYAFPAYVNRHEITVPGWAECDCQGNRLSALVV